MKISEIKVGNIYSKKFFKIITLIIYFKVIEINKQAKLL